jgi:hypothetical protein
LLGPLVPNVCRCYWAMKSSHLVESREGGLRVNVTQGRRLGCTYVRWWRPGTSTLMQAGRMPQYHQ